MTWGQAILSIVLALIAGVSSTITFFVKRKDDMKEKDVQNRINEAVLSAKSEIYEKLNQISTERSEEGAERFKIHAESFKTVNKQIEENTKQIGELTEISKNVLESMESMNKMVKVSAEGQRNTTYDRILIVGKKILSSKKISLSEKTNLKQLYTSYKALQGHEPYIDTLYEECMKQELVGDDRGVTEVC